MGWLPDLIAWVSGFVCGVIICSAIWQHDARCWREHKRERNNGRR